jgi:hypothetical protein
MSIALRKIICIGGLCLAVMIPLTGCCSHKPKPSKLEVAKGALDDLRAGVRSEIKDPTKAAEAVGLVDQTELLMMETIEVRKADEARTLSLNANFDATEEDFKAVFQEFNAKKISRQDRLVEIVQQAKALTTDREWKAITKVRSHALEAIVRAELEN